MKNKKLILIAAVSILFLTAMCSLADYEDSIKKSFDVEKNGMLTIESDVGSIEIKSHAKAVVKVEILRTLDSKRLVDNVMTEFEHREADVTITTEVKKGLFGFGRGIKLKYLITVPQQYNVDLTTAGGTISVDDLTGKVDSKTSGGSLSFGNIDGPVNGTTSGGNIRMDGCKGTAMIKTSGGSIKLGRVDGDVKAKTSGGSISIDKAVGSVNAKTSGGSIKVTEVRGDIQASTSGGSVTAHIAEQPKGDCHLSTSGGSVKVYLNKEIKVDIDAKTSGGRVKTDLPISVTVQGEAKKNMLQGSINGGGPELYLRTSGGNIYINKL